MQLETQPSAVVPSSVRGGGRRRALLALGALPFAGLFVLLFYRHADSSLLRSLQSLGSLWPALLLLELARVACELLSTRCLVGPGVAPARLVRGQLLGQMLDVLMPAGRTSAETAKAVVYAHDVGFARAAAVGAALQLAVLSANTLWILGAYALGGPLGLPGGLRVGMLLYVTSMTALVTGVTAFASRERVRNACARWPKLTATLESFARLWRSEPGRLLACVAAQLTGRIIQAAQLALVLSALEAHPSFAQLLLAQAVYLLGAALGELVPAQLGSTDGVFLLAAPAVGLSATGAFSASLAMHAVQVSVALACGALAACMWLVAPRRSAAATPREASILLQLPQ